MERAERRVHADDVVVGSVDVATDRASPHLPAGDVTPQDVVADHDDALRHHRVVATEHAPLLGHIHCFYMSMSRGAV